jgi:hypothetical protein
MSKHLLLPLVAAAIAVAAPAHANILIAVNKSSQSMAVSVDGAVRYHWPVSTARAGYNTPSGTYSLRIGEPRRARRHHNRGVGTLEPVPA